MGTKRKSARRMARPKKRTARPKAASRMARSRVGTVSHAYIRKSQLTSVVGNAAYTPLQSFSQIRFSGLINSNEFAVLYDQYRINWVKLQFYLKVDPSAQAAAAAIYPRLYWYRDQDDQTLATQSEMRERSNVKIAVLRPDKPVTIWVRPNLLNLIRSSGAVNTYRPSFGDWIDMTDTSADYMGIKWNVDNFTNTNYVLEVEQTYYFQCKDAR